MISDEDAAHHGNGEHREPSLLDVAKAAGVSAQTVSRVATGHGAVSPQTRLRVVDAIRRIGYRPNRAARALKTGRFRTIGVVVFSLTSFGSRSTLDSIASQAAAIGYSVALATLRDAEPRNVAEAFTRLSEQAVDGAIIVMEAHLIDREVLSRGWGFPIVVLDSSDQYDLPVVDHDQAQGARLATEHLLRLGHHSVWHVGGPPRSHSASRRRAAWETALLDHDRPVPSPVFGDWSSQSGHRAGAALAADPAVTAVFCANDEMALGVMQAMHRAGRRIPEDVSVVGFDGTPESAWYWPPLTTVRQQFAEVGSEALAQLVSLVEGVELDSARHSPVELIVRASTAPPGGLPARTQSPARS